MARTLASRARAILVACLPHHALARLVAGAGRARTRLKDPVVRWFVRAHGVDMTEAAEPDPTAYPSFNAFFTRPLRAGCRPLAGDGDTVVSPVDGRVSSAGSLAHGRLVQAKGVDYGLESLLGGDREAADALAGGAFATLYLAPGDYHRVHMPLTGRLRRMTHVPGRRYPVAPWSVVAVPGLFTRNERVACLFDGDTGPFAVTLVGALNVGAIEVAWTGRVVTGRSRGARTTHWHGDGPRLGRGDELGRFNLGSTVVLVVPAAVELDRTPAPGGRVRVGQALGRRAADAPAHVRL